MTDKPGKPSSQPSGRRSSRKPAAGKSEPAGNRAAAASRSKKPPQTDLSERQLGDFLLKRLLGRGGMAEVYLAEQLSLGRQVAVKVLRTSQLTGADDVMVRRFQQEAAAAAALNHPGIVQVLSVGCVDGLHFIAQEYVDGINLREFLSRKGPPSVPLALRMIRQIALAVQAAGEAGIVHRDIKPENIMVTRRGEVKVADFGLARLTHSEELVRLTQEGVTMGTPLYMSPEQVNGKPCDLRSDIYSLGVTSYHLLAGHPPFRGETAVSIAVQHLNSTPPPLAETRNDLPPAVCSMVHRMMAREPEERYQTAADLLVDLRKLLRADRDDPDSLSKVQLENETPPTAFQWKQHLRPVLLFCLVTALFSAGIGWLLRPGDPLRTTPPGSTYKVFQHETAAEQYVEALVLQNEAGWRAVIDNFKTRADERYRMRSLEQLGILLLRDNRLEEASRRFLELELAGTNSQEMRLRGIAGQALVLNRQGRYQDSQTKIDQYERQAQRRNRGDEQAGELRDMLNAARESNRGYLSGSSPAG